MTVTFERRLTRDWDDPGVIGIDGYRAKGGYEALRNALDTEPAAIEMDPARAPTPRPIQGRIPRGTGLQGGSFEPLAPRAAGRLDWKIFRPPAGVVLVALNGNVHAIRSGAVPQA